MEIKKIKFGTDGWRGIISDDFTMERVRIVTLGVCNYLKKVVEDRKPLVVIGYDTRFMSGHFASTAADVFGANDIKVLLSTEITPTPTLSTAVVNRKADLGIMITASHNPYHYNGYKIKGPFGGSATMDIIGDVEIEVEKVNSSYGRSGIPAEAKEDVSDNIIKENFTDEYIKHAIGQVDANTLRGFDFKVLFEPMYGASQDIFRKILSGFDAKNIVEIHAEINPGFGNLNPEPIGDNLNEAIEALRENKCQFGICLDGDADRIGALGEDGNYISSHHIFAMVLRDLAQRRKLKGRVIKTVTTSSIVDRICSKFDLELETTPVGFKYIGEKILEGGVIMGGEESGGLWSYGNIPERDGMIMGLRLLEIIRREKKTPNEILEDIYKEFGYFDYQRTDYEITMQQKEKLISILDEGTPGILKDEGAGEAITIDGYKYYLDENNWVMIRPSGTEAVVRIYSEGQSSEKSKYLQGLGKKIMDGIKG
jgi:phosphomannomutase